MSGTVYVGGKGTIQFFQDDTVTLSGPINVGHGTGAGAGSGIISQAGTGTSILNGTSSTFGGTVNVSSGTLQVGGTLGTVVANASVTGGTMQVNGTFGGNVTVNGGTLTGVGDS